MLWDGKMRIEVKWSHMKAMSSDISWTWKVKWIEAKLSKVEKWNTNGGDVSDIDYGNGDGEIKWGEVTQNA